MRRILRLLLLLLLISGQLFAQKNNRSTLRIRLSDGYPLTVAVNGRYFEKVGKVLTIGDLPKKRHNIKVYRYRAYKDGKGGKAELVYSGRIKIEPGASYDCIVDVNTHKFRMKEVGAFAEPPAAAARQLPPRAASDELPPANMQRSPALGALKQKVDGRDEDADKLKLLKQYITGVDSITTADIHDMASWLFFDDTRLDLVKYAYSKVSDKAAFASLTDIFTLDSSRKDFQQFLDAKK